MEATILEAPEVVMEQGKEKEIVQEKKKSAWDYMMENKKRPPRYMISNKEAEDLIFGSNMWVKLMQEEDLDEE
jgi:hypothetical protein